MVFQVVPEFIILFYGCYDQAGHFLFEPYGHSVSRVLAESRYKLPFRQEILDSTFAPRVPSQPEDITQLTYLHNWTILAMWDRSIDTRPGSNAAFVSPGINTEVEMWRRARHDFPDIVRRLKAAPQEKPSC